MEFDPSKEYLSEISIRKYPNGAKYVEAVIEDAKKTLPPGTEFSFISWDEGNERKRGWIYNPQTEREGQKIFNPTKGPLRT